MKRSLSLAVFLSASAVRGFQSCPQLSSSSQQLHRRLLASHSCRLPKTLYSSSTSTASETTASMQPANRYRFLREQEDETSTSAGGIRNVVDDYDVFLLDMWGVMHDGIKPYEGVPEVVQKLKDSKKKLIILSNSSKRRTNSVKMLQKLGFPDDTFDEIITSGEVAHHLLQYLADGTTSSWVPQSIPQAFSDLRAAAAAAQSEKQLSAVVFGSGDGDEEYLNSCGWQLADSIETADLIVARGTFVVESKEQRVHKNENQEGYWSAYQTALQEAAKADRPIPMVVCNPDKIRPDADKSPMPGTIGVAYQDLLQQHYPEESRNEDLILSLGKPFSGVYEIALASIAEENDDDQGSIDKSRVVMVGDALETDVTGATGTGIDSIWVIQDGIHNQDIAEASQSLQDGCEVVLQDFNKNSESTYAQGRQVSPTVVLPHFRW